jgi:hypothetical protein
MKKRIAVLSLFVLLGCISHDILAQCPMCKTALSTARDSGSSVGSSLNNGILYLLALPYTIAIVFGIIWYRNKRKKASATTI